MGALNKLDIVANNADFPEGKRPTHEQSQGVITFDTPLSPVDLLARVGAAVLQLERRELVDNKRKTQVSDLLTVDGYNAYLHGPNKGDNIQDRVYIGKLSAKDYGIFPNRT